MGVDGVPAARADEDDPRTVLADDGESLPIGPREAQLLQASNREICCGCRFTGEDHVPHCTDITSGVGNGDVEGAFGRAKGG